METKVSANYWWAMFIRGLAAIIFALLAFFWTGFTLELIIVLFGIYALLDGVFAIIASVKAMVKHKKWWLFLLEGIVGVVIALMVFFWPIETSVVLLYLIAIWAIVTGLLELFAGIAAAGWDMTGKWLVIFTGILSIILGIVMFAMPLTSITVIIWLIGIYALITGLFLVISSLKLKASE